MIANLEALAALADEGTMGKAAVRLRLSQSAVSKRVAALENELDKKLVERHGRRLKLTPAGVRLLEKTGPLVVALRQAALEESAPAGGRVIVGVSESLLASWVPALLQKVRRQMPELDLVLNAHRSPVAVERVRAGEYMLALCAGVAADLKDLKVFPLVEEPMVVVPAGLTRLRRKKGQSLKVITIENNAATWNCIEVPLRQAQKSWGFDIEVQSRLQSFTGIAQLARHGHGHGLVPLGVARALGIADRQLFRFLEPQLKRPVGLVGRPTVMALPLVARFCAALQENMQEDWE
jgi:DNA-binding transcriptional LysR family regulator